MGFAFTTSRSTYVLTLIIAGIVFWIVRRRLFSSTGTLIRSIVLTVVIALIMLGVFVVVSQQNPLDFIWAQLNSLSLVNNRASGVPNAIDSWLVAWYMFLGNPFWGWGWGSYVYFTQVYGVLNFAFSPVPNNLYLLVLAETGIIGLVALLWLFWRSLRLTLTSLPSKELNHSALLRALGASLLVTYVCFLFWDTIQYTYLWMLLGIAQVAYNLAIKESRLDTNSFCE